MGETCSVCNAKADSEPLEEIEAFQQTGHTFNDKESPEEEKQQPQEPMNETKKNEK